MTQLAPANSTFEGALEHYGALRTASLTQEASIQMEERKAKAAEDGVEQEEREAAYMRRRLENLKELIENKQQQRRQLERDIEDGHNLTSWLETRSMIGARRRASAPTTHCGLINLVFNVGARSAP